MMHVVIDAGRVMVCPDEGLEAAPEREDVDRKGLVEVAQGVYATPEAIDEALTREGVDRKRLVELAQGLYATPEAIEAALARVGVDRKRLVELAEGVYATPEAIEAAKKPRKAFDFLQILNTCGREARRALEILFKKYFLNNSRARTAPPVTHPPLSPGGPVGGSLFQVGGVFGKRG